MVTPIVVADTLTAVGVLVKPAPPTAVGFWEEFWAIKLGDVANFLAAFFSAVVAWLVYRYQQRKDEADTTRERDESRREWVRLFVMEPHVGVVLAFFQQLEDTAQQRLHTDRLTDDDRLGLFVEWSQQTLLFERRFVELLRSVDPALHTQIARIVDELRQALESTTDQLDPLRLPAALAQLRRHILDARHQLLDALLLFASR